MTAPKLVLIRHGESTANVAATSAEIAGLEAIAVEARDADIPLSALGEQQAAALGTRLNAELGGHSEFARVWSSPYRRAIQTAGLALGGATPITVDERLRDRELGIIDALTVRGVDVRLPAEAARRRWLGKFYYRPPGGEAWTDVALRLRSFVRDLDWEDERPVVVFAHDAVVTLFIYLFLRYTEEELDAFLASRVVRNASVTTLVCDAGGAWSVEAFSDDRHLEAAGVPVTEHPGAAHVSD
ncbi:MAG: glucosyl-3-phosphoglycerate phosphatase [Microbacteriaceae bacterium]|jgi:broad specificity phosphatase PhoE|nr:glucosyl-3-phosphoglycerate phosphatase [Microbacteriaceae bacterium]